MDGLRTLGIGCQQAFDAGIKRQQFHVVLNRQREQIRIGDLPMALYAATAGGLHGLKRKI